MDSVAAEFSAGLTDGSITGSSLTSESSPAADWQQLE